MEQTKYKIIAESLWKLCAEAKSEEEKGKIAEAFSGYFAAIERRQKGVIEAKVVSAAPIDEGERAHVIETIANFLHKDIVQVHAQFSVDHSLIGGLLVETDEMIIDGTVRMKLQKLKRALTA